jgi:histidinol-phosphate aminotransferase
VQASRDLGALAVAARDARVLWLCNPGNPSGAQWAAAEIAALADALPSVLVAVDEAYYEFGRETIAGAAVDRPNLVCIRTLSKAFGLAGLRVGYAIAARDVAAELSARRSPAPVSTTSAELAAAALRAPEVDDEVRRTVEERERMRGALADAGYGVPPVHANFVVARSARAPELAAELEQRGLVVRGYAESLRITVRTPADDDLVLRALGAPCPPSPRRAATAFGPRVRISLADGSGRVRSVTGSEERDRGLEELASRERLDLEAVAEPDASDAEVSAVVDEALGRLAGA